MRVLLDTNVFLSYILAPNRQGVVTAVVAACLSQSDITLLIPSEQIVELVDKLTNKRYFRIHVSRTVVEHFVTQLKALSNLHPVEDFKVYSRDPKDDYLLAYGVVNEAEYLISGDKDLLILTQVGTMRIVSPSQFFKVLQEKQN